MISKEEKELYLGEKYVDESQVEAMIEKVKEGQDAPMTEQIFPDQKPFKNTLNNNLSLKNGELRDDDDPVMQFIENYQPSTLIERQKFKRDLLIILESWK